MIDNALNQLKHYCQNQDYNGWDNFDGLNSKIFKNSPFYKSSLLRLSWIQFFKRSPFNFRRLAIVKKGTNAKGLALFISGLVAQGKCNEAASLVDRLKKMRYSGYSGSSWGYNFDWQSRRFLTPIGTPNTVTTVFVANALLDYYEAIQDEECLDLAQEGCEFFLRNLTLHEDKKTLCIGYMPGNNSRVHNVTMLGGALLGRIYRLTTKGQYYEKSKKAIAYAVGALRDDFSWPYGESSIHQFIDNFHSGFNLVALSDWMAYTRDDCWRQELNRAYAYYQRTFWLDDGCPKYYHNSLYPIDIHCSAQGIITFLKISPRSEQRADMARKIAGWAIANMQDKAGYFYYQKGRWITNKIPYMRWSQAWMFYALSLLARNEGNPCEKWRCPKVEFSLNLRGESSL